jgi:hypothetical protein
MHRYLYNLTQKVVSSHHNSNIPIEWAFLKRHLTIVQRTSEAVSAASACVSETNIRKWFHEIEIYLMSKNINIDGPFNTDAIDFSKCLAKDNKPIEVDFH